MPVAIRDPWSLGLHLLHVNVLSLLLPVPGRLLTCKLYVMSMVSRGSTLQPVLAKGIHTAPVCQHFRDGSPSIHICLQIYVRTFTCVFLVCAAFEGAPQELDMRMFDPSSPQAGSIHRGAAELVAQVRPRSVPSDKMTSFTLFAGGSK